MTILNTYKVQIQTKTDLSGLFMKSHIVEAPCVSTAKDIVKELENGSVRRGALLVTQL